jgi:hypothetical protein
MRPVLTEYRALGLSGALSVGDAGVVGKDFPCSNNFVGVIASDNVDGDDGEPGGVTIFTSFFVGVVEPDKLTFDNPREDILERTGEVVVDGDESLATTGDVDDIVLGNDEEVSANDF